MNTPSIIRDALNEYDTAAEIIKPLYGLNYNIINTDNDYQRSRIIFKNKNTETVLDTEFEILAIFYEKFNIWSWAWSQPGLINSENYLSKEILRYSLNLGSDLTYIKSLLSTSRGIIYDKMQIDINLAISSSFIKQPYIYEFYNEIDGYGLSYYFILLNKEGIKKFYEEINLSHKH